MKKSLIALAVLAAAGTASAQSSVTLFGIVDATLQRVSHKGGTSVTRLTNSGYNSSRLGFRGTEDLGGGMSASFWLEGALSNDDGTPAGLMFLRRSTVSLAGGWGELRLGRDYTPQFWNLTVFDPFGTNGVGSTQTLAGNGAIPATGTTPAVGLSPLAYTPNLVRASNSIGYFLPGKLGGFYGQAQYTLGAEAASTAVNPDLGEGWGVRLGYASGPFNVALALSRTEITAFGVNTDMTQNNVGGQYDFGMAKLMGHYTWDEVDGFKGRGWLVGGLVPVGAGEVRLAYSQYRSDDLGFGEPKSRKVALGYVHNLSKRTAVYTTYARVRNSGLANSPVTGGAGTPGFGASSSGFDLGIRHAF